MTSFASRNRGRLAVAVVAAGVLTLSACGSSGGGGTDANGLPQGSGTAPNTDGKLGVVASANFWGDIASQIGGDEVAVTSIISNPQIDPHEYEADVNDSAAIEHASLVIENGLGYDDFVDKLVSAHANSGRTVVKIADAIGVHGDVNPHLWYSPPYVISAARAIEQHLAAKDAADASTFETNLRSFLEGEQKVADVIAQIKAKYNGEAIAYTERVPGYLMEAAGLHLGTPASFSQTIEDGGDPSPIDNAAFESALTDHKVKVLLYNAQVTDAETKHLKQLAASSGIPVVGVAETLPANEKDFQTWQADQAKALLAALGG
jgi:zinc/manganese transport system substrate-binding protein